MIDAYARTLANARSKTEALKHEEELLQIQLAETELGKALADKKAEIKDSLDVLAAAEEEMREAALAEYGATSEKILTGCKIAIYTTLDYSEAKATSWCVEHNHSNLLKLNKSAFEKVAKELTPEFVTIGEEPRVRIDGDLSQFLTGD